MTLLKRPRLLPILLAALAMFLIGFLIYGVLFYELWSKETLMDRGLISVDEARTLTGAALTEALSRIPNQLPQLQGIALGLAVYLLTATGLSVVLRLIRPSSLAGALRVSFILWATFAATTLAYNVVYSSESRTLFILDLGHLLLGYLVGGAILFFVDVRPAKPAPNPQAGA
jgi:hypothetical protein